MWRAIILGLALSLAAASARGEQIGPSPAASTSQEVATGGLQVTVGLLGTFLSFAPAAASLQLNGWGIPVSFALLAPVPLVTGSIVCGIGHVGSAYRGGCGAPILGAYLGSLSSIPLGYLLCKARQNQPSSGDEALGCVSGVLLGILIGEGVGGTVGATIGWHLAKKPRAASDELVAPPVPAPARADDWPELRLRPAPSTPPGTTVSVPLLALAF